MTTFTHAGSGSTVTYPAGHRLHDVFTASPNWEATTTQSGQDAPKDGEATTTQSGQDEPKDGADTPEEEVSGGGGKRTAARGGRRRTQAAAD